MSTLTMELFIFKTIKTAFCFRSTVYIRFWPLLHKSLRPYHAPCFKKYVYGSYRANRQYAGHVTLKHPFVIYIPNAMDYIIWVKMVSGISQLANDHGSRNYGYKVLFMIIRVH